MKINTFGIKTSNKQVGLIKTKQIKEFINNIFQSIEDGPNKKDLKNFNRNLL